MCRYSEHHVVKPLRGLASRGLATQSALRDWALLFNRFAAAGLHTGSRRQGRRLTAAVDLSKTTMAHAPGYFATDRRHPTFHRGTTDFTVVKVGPVFEQFARRAAQVVAEPFGLTVAFVNQRLKITFQMGPAPLQTVDAPVHLRPITHHDAVECVGQKIIYGRRLARGTHREDRKHPRDDFRGLVPCTRCPRSRPHFFSLKGLTTHWDRLSSLILRKAMRQAACDSHRH